MIRGYVFDNQLASHDVDSMIFRKMLNYNDGIFTGMELSYTNTSITVHDGIIMIAGRPVEIINNETVGIDSDNAYCKVVLEIDLTKEASVENFEQASLKIIKGTTSYPEVTQNDMDNGGTVYQVELARFKTIANRIVDFMDMRTFLNLDSIYDQIDSKFSGLLTQLEDELEQIADRSGLVLESSFKKISGSIDLRLNENGNYLDSFDLTYPTGFNMDNINILSVKTWNGVSSAYMPMKNQGSVTGGTTEYVNGFCEYKATFYENKITVVLQSKGNSSAQTLPIGYEIVLFKK